MSQPRQTTSNRKKKTEEFLNWHHGLTDAQKKAFSAKVGQVGKARLGADKASPHTDAVARKLKLKKEGYNPDYKSTRDKASNAGSHLLRVIGDNLSSKNPENKDDLLQKIGKKKPSSVSSGATRGRGASVDQMVKSGANRAAIERLLEKKRKAKK